MKEVGKVFLATNSDFNYTDVSQPPHPGQMWVGGGSALSSLPFMKAHPS